MRGDLTELDVRETAKRLPGEVEDREHFDEIAGLAEVDENGARSRRSASTGPIRDLRP